MTLRILSVLLITLQLALHAITPASAAEFEIERVDLRPILPLKLSITMTGQIESGDAERLNAAITASREEGMRDILFLIDSPGGSLLEGLALGRLIASLPEIVSAQVGWSERQDAICASACVLAYLGAEYRYLAQEGRIGVHRFSAPGAEMDGAEGIARAQELSALLTEYIRGQRADPALYERMARTDAADIDWVERSTLEEWRVVTGPVFDEWVEVRNVNGSAALHLSQVALYGDNAVTLLCGNLGLVGVAALNKPVVHAYGRMAITVDGVEIPIEDFEVVERGETIDRIVFAIPDAYGRRIALASRFGARVVFPSGNGFFGFEMGIRDARLRQMVEGCRPAAGTPSTPAMRIAQGFDYPGGDMTGAGLRGIELGACLALCEEDRTCRAVSYVIEKKWCWPKSSVGHAVAAPGVVSAVK